jgi:hypothetical protein
MAIVQSPRGLERYIRPTHSDGGRLNMYFNHPDMDWEVNVEIRGNLPVHVIILHKMKAGRHAGHYHPIFWKIPTAAISPYIDPSYDYWEVRAGEEVLMSNLNMVADSFGISAEPKDWETKNQGDDEIEIGNQSPSEVLQ